MGNCSLLLPTLFGHLWDLVAQNSSVTSSSPPFVPISSLSKRPFGTWSLMTWQCSSVKLSYLCYKMRNATTWTGLFCPLHSPHSSLQELRGKTCVCISVCDFTFCSTLPGVSWRWTPYYKQMLFSAFDVYWPLHTGFSKNQR